MDPQYDEKTPNFPNQNDMNDLIRDLALTKSNAELLTSRLKQWNLAPEAVKVTDQRKRHLSYAQFFNMSNGICYCTNIEGFFEALKLQ